MLGNHERRPLAPSKSTYVILASSSVAILAWKILQWRARTRAQNVAYLAQSMVQDGPMIKCSDPSVRLSVLNAAIQRASKWISYQNADDAQPMRGQVGGVSFHKRPMLTLAPDYVLKPLHLDDRGFREIAFYEALKLASSQLAGAKGGNNAAAVIAAMAAGGTRRDNIVRNGTAASGMNKAALDNWDLVAMWLAIFSRDSIVMESEHTLQSSWKAMKKEVESLRRLLNFTAAYYGVVGQKPVQSPNLSYPKPSEISRESYLMLSDATINFSKPCTIDLKMGQQTYEPDALPEKREREYAKYPEQSTFGFRIVGMRIYDPLNLTSDPSGFRTFGKYFGRSLRSREEVVNALQMFFCHSAASYDDRQISNKATRDGTNQYAVSELRKKREAALSLPHGRYDIVRSRAIVNLILQLRYIRRWFEENVALRFYSSSLLMVYEGDVSVNNRDLTNLKMIDFGHVRRESGGDHGYLHGVQTLMDMLSELLEEGK